MSEYTSKVEEEISYHAGPKIVHDDLPAIFHYWSTNFLRPLYQKVIGGEVSTPSFYASHFADLRKPEISLLSIGCGSCAVELEVAEKLIAGGHTGLRFDCIDLSPDSLAKAERKIAEKKLQSYFNLEQRDLSYWRPERSYQGVMAHFTLHHMSSLETVLDGVREGLGEGGLFVSQDVIGRNGHMRWPEALRLIESMWEFLPEGYKFNHKRRIFEAQFENWDCSQVGFEGARCQEILPALVKRFHFRKFLGYGNLVDVFIDRAFGPNLDPKRDEDLAFINYLEMLNRILIDGGYLKPTSMFAVMSNTPGPQRFYRHWSPEFCMRDPVAAPDLP